MGSDMLEFRLHGRGGQGIVVAAAVFAEAVFLSGSYARAFSLFGAERRGAPVTAFVRINSERLMPRSRIYEPDYSVVFDPTIDGSVLVAGLKKGGTMLVNADQGWATRVPFEDLRSKNIRLFLVDAREIALKHKLAIGSFPMVNTVMLGAMAKISGLAALDELNSSIEKRVSSKIEANINAAADGYAGVREVDCLAPSCS
jgi:2-oxoacid:acceptor oxidoreductase gamma subunit (pyruvate/2-ketoisovalerate family)